MDMSGKLRTLCRSCSALVTRGIQTSVQHQKSADRHSPKGYGGAWRHSQGQAVNKTRYGPLTDLPDFTFLDGRPTPLTPGQEQRKAERKATTARIMQLLKEVDAIKEHEKKQESILEEQRQTLQKLKLKPKARS